MCWCVEKKKHTLLCLSFFLSSHEPDQDTTAVMFRMYVDFSLNYSSRLRLTIENCLCACVCSATERNSRLERAVCLQAAPSSITCFIPESLKREMKFDGLHHRSQAQMPSPGRKSLLPASVSCAGKINK